MNITKILNKSLAWLSYKDKKAVCINRDFSNQLQATLTHASGRLIGFETNRGEAWCYYLGNEVKYAANPALGATKLAQVSPHELYILTQVILHTLNTECDRFHDMSELPGLENRNCNQLGTLVRYLVKQGWVEAKTIEDTFLVKLSIQGKTFVGNHTHAAWA